MLLMVTFTNLSQDATSYDWAFGDGETSAEQDPVHVYGTAGAYTVTLTATGPGGSDIHTRARYVTVSGSDPITLTRVISYTYDPLGRLTAADYSTGESFAYAYDAVGNRTAMTTTTPLDGTTITTYTYDAKQAWLPIA
jgi:YD repeat-containing protein